MANYWIGLSRIIPKLFSFDHGDHGGSPSHHFIIPRCRWKPPSGPESLAKSIGPHRCDRGLSKVGRGQWIWWRVCLWYDQFKIYFLGIAGTTYVLYTISMYTHTHICIYIYIHTVSTKISPASAHGAMWTKLFQVAIRLLCGKVALAGWEGERPGGLKSHPGGLWKRVLGWQSEWGDGRGISWDFYKYKSIYIYIMIFKNI